MCILVMRNGHLHEDAYILFQYSRNFSQGLGISFDVVNGPAEGATDFLWMCLLGIFHRIFMGNIEIGVIAASLNSIGLAYITREVINIRKSVDLNTIAICILLIVSGGAAAAIGGFSTAAFGAVYVATILSFFRNKFNQGLVFSTLLALFRPDGFFLGSATIIAYLFLELPELDAKQTAKKLTIFYLIPLITYFFWRYTYFGLLLPLPLIVKQNTDFMFEGIRPNMKSLVGYSPVITGILLYFRSYIEANTNKRFFILAFSGSLTLFMLLIFAHQSQNVGMRFQFPLHLSIILLASSIFPKTTKTSILSSALIFISIVYFSRGFHANINYLTNSDYINSFPQILRQRLDINSIAVTEAGRFPYWYNADSMVDLVGLNSKNVVTNGPIAELEEKNPDLIFIHHAGRFIYPDELIGTGDNFVIFDPNSIKLSEYNGSNPVKLAPAAALENAINRSLTGIAVKYGKKNKYFSHVYFVPDSVNLKKFKTAVADSFLTKTNYFASEKPNKNQ
ncbi:hypothetical protein [Synechococcus sp. M16.1]|uniref:hypothetical protein n=1 Tax=Synechococcus sp. M16.1 TaxID=1442553 RepID=UPI0016494A80|nr:hypothetical protein [Synechococcus sp. M16.1]